MAEVQANQEQIRFWNEQGGPRWVKRQQQLDEQISQLGLLAMQRAKVQPGERVLDVGCGCGQTALELAEQVGPQGAVLGVDISAPMLARAQERQHERGLTNLTFLQADAQMHQFERARFDLLFSRFGVMFFEDPAAAFANLHTALRPGGRLCFVCWQTVDKNEWVRVPLAAATKHVPLPPPPSPDAPGPFAFANPDRVRSVLGAGGFKEVSLEPAQTALTMGGAVTVEEAVDFLLEIGPVARLLLDAGEAVRARVVEEMRAALTPYTSSNGVRMGGAAWIVTAQ